VGLGGELPVPVGQAGGFPSGRNPAGHGRPLSRRITDAGGLRSQFTHCIDIGPTILGLAGIPQPTHVEGIAQTPMHGTSFLHTFADAAAEERHTQQYFEIYGYRAMYKDGWWLAQQIDRIPWDLTPAMVRKFAPGVW
jgi:arylsulfatase A-like enzyme